MNNKIKDAAKALIGKPVSNQAFRIKKIAKEIEELKWFDFEQEHWQHSQNLITNRYIQKEKEKQNEIKKIQWLVCNFEHPYGGVYTIFRIANFLQEKKFKSKIVIYDNPEFNVKEKIIEIQKKFKNLSEENFIVIKNQNQILELEKADIGVATFWSSAYHLIKMKNVKSKVYLIQDYESEFYCASSQSALAQCTYRMPFNRLYNTIGLQNYINNNFNLKFGKELHFTPATDENYHFVFKPISFPIKILIYARPNTPRNAFELTVGVAKVLKEKYGNKIEIVGAGERSKDIVELCAGVIDFVGIIDYEKLPKFYAQFHFMISFMMTKHPSYLPFEGMACGCCVVANANEYNEWFLKNGENCVVAQPTINSMVHAFDSIIGNPEKYSEIVANARKIVEKLSWEKEIRKVENFFLEL